MIELEPLPSFTDYLNNPIIAIICVLAVIGILVLLFFVIRDHTFFECSVIGLGIFVFGMIGLSFYTAMENDKLREENIEKIEEYYHLEFPPDNDVYPKDDGYLTIENVNSSDDETLVYEKVQVRRSGDSVNVFILKENTTSEFMELIPSN